MTEPVASGCLVGDFFDGVVLGVVDALVRDYGVAGALGGAVFLGVTRLLFLGCSFVFGACFGVPVRVLRAASIAGTLDGLAGVIAGVIVCCLIFGFAGGAMAALGLIGSFRCLLMLDAFQAASSAAFAVALLVCILVSSAPCS